MKFIFLRGVPLEPQFIFWWEGGGIAKGFGDCPHLFIFLVDCEGVRGCPHHHIFFRHGKGVRGLFPPPHFLSEVRRGSGATAKPPIIRGFTPLRYFVRGVAPITPPHFSRKRNGGKSAFFSLSQRKETKEMLSCQTFRIPHWVFFRK